MKKKRLLAVFAAFAIAATMAIGVTACGNTNGNSGGNTQTGQPGGEENPNGPEDKKPEEADNSVTTKEQWIKAWQDSAAATSFTLVEDGVRYRPAEDSQEPVPYNYHMEMEYDNVNKVVHSLGRIDGQYSEYYYAIEGDIMYEYSRFSEDAEWGCNKGDVAYWFYIKHWLEYIASWPYTVTGAANGAGGTIAELFDYAEYKSSTKTYTLHLTTNNTELATYEIQFCGGYLYKFTVDGDSFGKTLSEEITVKGVNCTTLTVPQEVKDAAQELTTE